MISRYTGEFSRHRVRLAELAESFPDFWKWFSHLPEWFRDACNPLPNSENRANDAGHLQQNSWQGFCFSKIVPWEHKH